MPLDIGSNYRQTQKHTQLLSSPVDSEHSISRHGDWPLTDSHIPYRTYVITFGDNGNAEARAMKPANLPLPGGVHFAHHILSVGIAASMLIRPNGNGRMETRCPLSRLSVTVKVCVSAIHIISVPDWGKSSRGMVHVLG
jgi:hypothetical protein